MNVDLFYGKFSRQTHFVFFFNTENIYILCARSYEFRTTHHIAAIADTPNTTE